MLEVKNLNVFYGKLQILWDLSMQVGDESVGLFGPNGAGKTTLINTVLGLVKPVSGIITLDGESLVKLETDKIIKMGISIVPQDRELFPFMTVEENLRAGNAYIPRARKKYAGAIGICLGNVPRPQRPLNATGRKFKRGPAENGGHWKGLNGRSQGFDP